MPTPIILQSSYATRPFDGNASVASVGFLLTGTETAIDYIDLRYVPTGTASELSTETVNPVDVRIEVPGSGTGAPDLTVGRPVATITTATALQRTNNQRSLFIQVSAPIPAPTPAFPFTRLSVRFVAPADMPANGGFTKTPAQRAVVEVP